MVLDDFQDLIKQHYTQINVKSTNYYLSFYLIDLEIENKLFKINTDFNRYCYIIQNSEYQVKIDDFNTKIMFLEKNSRNILDTLLSVLTDSRSQDINNDPFNITQKISEHYKIDIDFVEYNNLFDNYQDNNKYTINNKYPKNLLLSKHQMRKLIINEIKKVNSNFTHEHYIIPDNNNPYVLIVRLKYNNKIFDKIKKLYDYDYMELKIIIDSKLYPFMPPTLEYVKPKIKSELLFTIINQSIFKISNWLPTYNLDYIMTNLGYKLKDYLDEYIILDNNIDHLDYEINKLLNISNINNNKNLFDIKLPINVNSDSHDNSKYWKKGTGFGVDGFDAWDINGYIQEKELQKHKELKCLHNINILFKNNNDITKISLLLNYISLQLEGINILELEKNIEYYNELFITLNESYKYLNDKNIFAFVKNNYPNLNKLYNELNIIELNDNNLNNIKNIISKFTEVNNINQNSENMISTTEYDIKKLYIKIMKDLQFGIYDIPSYHKYYGLINNTCTAKALLRIVSELSSFKSSLTLNWESSIWVRISKTNNNLFTFLISGPNNTPYENGLFEFHAYFPPDYPNSVPSVTLNTTGGGKVRFNPNLYESGKVCLSLLGTWTGQEGESWCSQTSTFIQVMISIQSLILVEEPYFNEPGWEKRMNTETGILQSKSYNEKLYAHTIGLAMIDMIKSPPIGFEDVIKNHFKLKKDEIIETTLKWHTSASENNKEQIDHNRKILLNLLNEL